MVAPSDRQSQVSKTGCRLQRRLRDYVEQHEGIKGEVFKAIIRSCQAITGEEMG
jgi:hypothetical protein